MKKLFRNFRSAFSRSRKTLLFSLLSLLAFSFLLSSCSKEKSVEKKGSGKNKIYAFVSKTCPHCAAEKKFLEKLVQKYDDLEVIYLEVSDKKNVDILSEVSRELDFEVRGVPVTIVGRDYFIGFGDEETTGVVIERMFLNCRAQPCEDFVGKVIERVQKEEESGKILHFFWASGCPICQKEKEYLSGEFLKIHSDFRVRSYDVTTDSFGRELLQKVIKELEIKNPGLPLVVVGKSYLVGWSLTDEHSKEALDEIVSCAKDEFCEDVVGKIASNLTKEATSDKEGHLPEKISLPLFGEVNLKSVSLPVLAVMVGFLDGFNPCAMWVLVFLISLLIKLSDKKRRYILGVSFIAISALTYFLFMAAWLNLFLFLGVVFWIRVGIGVLAVSFGVMNLRDFFKNKEVTCKVTKSEKRKSYFERLKGVVTKESFVLALLGTIVLAFSVNLVELLCSAGFPAIFTQILALSKLSFFEYYALLFIYILFYMLDDVIVFVLSMKALEITGLTTKYTRYSNLIGGALMLLIGILLIFKPEVLMFG